MTPKKSLLWRRALVASLFSVFLSLAGATPLITEFMASNSTTLADEDGAFPDWIEIHNPDGETVNLDGYFLTDNAGSPSKWRVPGVSIDPGGFLVVFASSKDRAIAGGELHTNFGLSAGGEYLALVAPDGVTVLSEFNFPSQDPNRSFGVAFDGVPLLSEGATARYFVPSNGTLGTSWTGAGFSDGSWASGVTGLGFGLQVPGMTLREIHSTGTVNSLANVDALLGGSGVASETTVVVQTFNHLDDGGAGNYGNDQIFPGGGGDDFIAVATGTLVIPTAGAWTFGLNSDDGGRIRIDGFDVMVDDTLHGAQNFLGTRTLSAGAHTFEAVFFERGGGASCEFFALAGTHGAWNSSFRLVGDVAGGGLAAFTSPEGAGGGGGGAGVIATDLSGPMSGRTSAYVRLPFSVSDPGALDSLSLSMRYNDGFVAYVNGVQVAARNVPGAVSWNSVATTGRDGADSLVAEAINLTAAIPNLNAGGGNVLAIHGLNVSAADDSFLVLPELTGGGLAAGAPVYFDGPTPGSINSAPSSFGKVADTKFTPDRGFYPNSAYPTMPLSVEITTATEGAVIRYTTDGSTPSATNGTVYTVPVTVSGTTTLRAVATKVGFDPTNVDTHTYLVLDDVITQSQSAPAGWPSGTVNGQVFDYGMDPDIVNSGNAAIGGAAQVKSALSAIPTISIVTDQANLTDAGSGIYTHAGNRGFGWERASSAELIFPEGYVDPDGNVEGFQVDAGLRIRGGFSRSGGNPKHALRLFFREEYGDSKLNYPMFGDEGVSEFDNLDFRTSQNYSWAFQNDGSRNTFLREVFSRDTQRDMGVPYTRSRYYHMYLNGIYWGLYMTQERAEASYAESYFGGDKDDWDVVKSAGSSGGYTSEVTDGFFDDWEDLWQMGRNLVEPGFGGNRAAEYYKMQGLNPDGTRNPAYPVLLDLENLIDYMIVTFWVGNFDAPLSNFLGNDRPNNWFGMRNRTNPDQGFVFFAHDAEHSLFPGWDRTGPWNSGNRANVAYSNPQFLHEDLLQNLDATTRREYQMAWADRVQQHMFGDGVLVPEVARTRIEARAAIVDQVIIAESARWGDAKGANPPHDRNSWIGARNSLLNSYLPGRNAQVLGQFRGDDLYPQTDAPTLSQQGGYISSTDLLAMSSTGGTIYYYTDGRDPRLPGGGLNGSPPIFVGSTSTTTFINTKSSWRYLDNGSNQGTAWRANGFNDAGWSTGNAELGYGDTQDTEIGYRPDANDKYVTTYFRKTFSVTDAASYDTLTVELQRDDGGVVYLNGDLIFNSNLPGTYDFQTSALAVVGGADETTLFSNAANPGLLVEGTNTIAVEIHQYHDAGQPVTSSDISFDLRLSGTKTTSSNPVNLSGPGEVTVKTRARDGGDWSAVNVATFFVDLVPASPANLAISEISYRPAAPSVEELGAGFNDRDDFEFIELTNAGTDNVHLRDLAFTDGVEFDFNTAATGLVLLPGERVLFVRNQAAFEFRYGTELPVAGEYSGALNNDGEMLVLSDANGDELHGLTYNDQLPWPTAADGDGFSMVLIMPAGGAVPDHSDARNWRASVGIGGSPGSGDGTSYAAWKADEGVASDGDDRDGDGLDAVAEYALEGDPDRPDPEKLPSGSVESLDVGGVVDDYLVVRVRRRAGADDLVVTVELGDDLSAGGWSEVPVAYVGVEKNPDGSETLIFRSADPVGSAAGGKAFMRVRFGV